MKSEFDNVRVANVSNADLGMAFRLCVRLNARTAVVLAYELVMSVLVTLTSATLGLLGSVMLVPVVLMLAPVMLGPVLVT